MRRFQEHTGEHPLDMEQCVNSESEHVHNTMLPVVQEQAIKEFQESGHVHLVQEQAIEEFQESGLGGTAEHTEREQPLFKGTGVNSCCARQ